MSNDAVAHSFNTLGIVGTGAMGRGIAQLAAQAGLNVMLFDVKEGAVAEATAFINGLWQRSADKQRITQAQAEQYG
ncbi:MAG TPA: 3-hydroxyacyl-CoA dehydrogenase, partial [Halomonas sp.]|nr:3-hydroxyacyl-CoA dehydrogenase [Halomonas sp.]